MEQKLETEQGISGIRMALETMIDMSKTIGKIKPENVREIQFSPTSKIEFGEKGFSSEYENSDGIKYEITITRRE